MRHALAARRGTALALLWLAVCAGPLLADQGASYDSKRIASMEVGIFCRGEVGASPSPESGTIKGTVERLDGNPPLVKKTRTVPAIDQITFGVEAQEAVENGVVTITVTHPPLGPGRVTTERWETQMDTARTTVHTYYLGLSDGNPVGRWTIVGSVGSRTLFQAKFDVVPRKSAKDPCRNRVNS
jgi:Domain of unknown function (DUF3859)